MSSVCMTTHIIGSKDCRDKMENKDLCDKTLLGAHDESRCHCFQAHFPLVIHISCIWVNFYI